MTTESPEVNEKSSPADAREARAEELAAAPWDCIEAAGAAKIDDPALFAAIARRVEAVLTYKEARIWTAAVNEEARRVKAERAAHKESASSRIAREILERGRALELPVFKVGDQAELARFTVMALEDGGEPLAYDFGHLHRYDAAAGLWRPIHDEEISNLIQGWSGAPIVGAELGNLKIAAATVQGAIQLATHKPSAWGRGSGWLAQAPKGIAFQDGFWRVVEPPDGAPRLEAVDHSPDNRALVGYNFPYDPNATAPLFQEYLKAIWGGLPDFEERCALLQEFAGAALTGMAPRYKRALVLYGYKGTGKSTFLKIIRGMFPAGALAQVQPKDFLDDNKLAALGPAKLNTVFELTADHLKHHERIKEVLDGEKIQIREVYKRETSIWPRAAHLYATNELFKAPGADPSFWDRWIVIDLKADRSWRGKAGEKRELADTILAAELPGLVTWALKGAARLFAQDERGYTVPSCADEVMAGWKLEADVVGVWMAERVKEKNGPAWIGAMDLFVDFKKWRDANGYADRFNSRSFWQRLKNLGVEHKVSNGSKFNLELYGSTSTDWMDARDEVT